MKFPHRSVDLRGFSRIRWLIATMLVVGYVLLEVSNSPHVGVTFDEPGHITSGYGYWRTGDFRINAENGVLSSRLVSLPLLGMNLNFAGERSSAWSSPNSRALGLEFFFESGNEFTSLLNRSRAVSAILGAGVLCLIWGWTRKLFGTGAAILAVLIGAFSPTLLAHGGLATSDIALTFFLLAGLTAFWRLWHLVTWWRLLVAVLASGGALTAKMSGLLLVPLLVPLLALRCLYQAPIRVRLGRHRLVRGRWGKFIACVTTGAVVGAGSLVIIWSSYNFRYSIVPKDASPGATLQLSWSELLAGEGPRNPVKGSSVELSHERIAPPAAGAIVRGMSWARERRLLPEAYLWGATFTYQASRERLGFFLGKCSLTGWKSFFPVAFLLKSTPPEIILFGCGVLGFAVTEWRRRRRATCGIKFQGVYRAAPLIVLFVCYWTTAVVTPLNIGHRHLLPIYPVVWMLCGAALLIATARSRVIIMIAALTFSIWHVALSLQVRPLYLSYFTPFVGGVKEGWRYLVDSSYDWGQGLPAFKQWVDRRRREEDHTPIFLTYFGSDSTRARQIEVTRFADWRDFVGPRSLPAQLRGGWYAISATHFHGIYLGLCGPWTADLENKYIRTLNSLPRTQEAVTNFTEPEQATFRANAMLFEILAFGRLCHFLRNRTPIEIIGGSILLFRLSDEEVSLVISAPLDAINARMSKP